LASTAGQTISDVVARIATDIAPRQTGKQFSELDPRQVNQVTTGTACVAATIATARTTRIAAGVARIARSTVGISVAGITWTTIGIAAAFQTFEQSAEVELRRGTGRTAGIAIGNDGAWSAVGNDIAWGACRSGKQTTQTSTQTDFGYAANFVAGITKRGFIAWIAGNDWFARIAVIDTNSIDQFLKTGKQVTLYNTRVTRATRGNTCRVTRTRKALDTQHEGDREGRH
jgi:hypothetical protein